MESNENYFSVYEILKSNNLMHLSQQFYDNGIDDKTFVIMDIEDFHQFNLNFGEKKKLMHSLDAYKVIQSESCIPFVIENGNIPSTDASTVLSGTSNEIVREPQVLLLKHQIGRGFVRKSATYGQIKPWPLHYELPDFNSILTQKLESKEKLNSSDKIHIIDVLFDQLFSFFTYRFPTSELELVCRAFIEKYPHLIGEENCGHEYLMDKLRVKFRNRRHNSRKLTDKLPDYVRGFVKNSDSANSSFTDITETLINDIEEEAIIVEQNEIITKENDMRSEENSSISEECVTSNFESIKKTKVSKVLKLKSNRKNNLSQLLKKYPKLRTIEGFEKQLQSSIKSNYSQSFDPENNYFSRFLTNGCIVYERLRESDSYKSFGVKYKKYSGTSEKTTNNPKSDQKIGENVCKSNNGSNHNNQTLILCRNECLDESETLQNKTSVKVNENNIIDKQSINSLIENLDKECNQNIDTNGEKVNNSKSCDNNETQSKFESKSIEKSIHKEKRFETELDVSEENESITAFDIDMDSSQTEIDSHFDDKKKRNKTVNKSNCLSNKFKCDFIGCGKVYKRKHSLKDHKLSHDLNAIQRVKCDICSKIYESITAFKSLKEHQKRKHFELFPELKILNCQKCDFKTKSFSYFNEHNERHKSKENNNLFKCEFENCLKSYSKMYKLNEHKRTTHLGFVYKCDFKNCEKVFRDRNGLRTHKLRHKGIKNYVCNECGKSFFENKHLNVHMNSHTGLKPYVCEWPGCEKRFAYSSLLSIHRRYHKNDRNLVCDWPQCQYKSVTKYNLDKHKAIHTGEKKFECFWPGCEHKTANQSNLKLHQKQHK